MIDKVREVLSRNPNIPTEFKDVILVNVMFILDSPLISDKQNLNIERLANLSFEEINNYVGFGLPANYVASENKLKLNPTALLKTDQSQVFLQQLLNIVTYKENVDLLAIDRNQAIFDGYASLLSKNILALNGLESESNIDYYFDEEVVVNLLGKIAGVNVLESVYLNKNIDILVNTLKNKGVSEKDVTSLLSLINHNQKTRNMSGLSNLSSLQKMIIDMAKNAKLDKNQLNEVKLNLVDNENYVPSNNVKYQGISEVKNYYDRILGSIVIDEPIKEVEVEGMVR